jgi:hypothetical protein
MNTEVDTYLTGLDHPMKAPSFCFDGVDRVTFKLHPPVRIELIFHRGAKVNPAPFTFADDTGLMRFLTPDRAIVTLHTMADVDAHTASLVVLVNRWVAQS